MKKGQTLLFPEVRYFFHSTNREDLTAAVFFANEWCDQENPIGPLKNGVGALWMPVGIW